MKNKKNILLGIIGFILIIIIILFLIIMFDRDKKINNLNNIIIDLTNLYTKDKSIILNKDELIINKGGNYILQGKYNGRILIDAKSKTNITLNSVNIDTKYNPCISILKGSPVDFIIPAYSRNYLKDMYSSSTIYSEEDISIDGIGSLTIMSGGEYGINILNNSFTIKGSILEINGNSSIKAKDIKVLGGEIYFNSKKDSIISDNLIINDGNIYISSLINGLNIKNPYIINGGRSVILSQINNSVLDDNSKEDVFVFKTEDKILKDTTSFLTDSDDKLIISFSNNNDYNLCIISVPGVNKKSYNLYINGYNEGKKVRGVYGKGKYILGSKKNIY
ncbi:MAG: carbohydrate-binding domain-containing protein [Bacilli bacterium]